MHQRDSKCHTAHGRGTGVGTENRVGPVNTSSGGWRPYLAAVGAQDCITTGSPSAAVVGLGAICDLRRPAETQTGVRSFAVHEFVTLANGDRLVLHRDRGFTLSIDTGESEPLSAALLVRQTLNTVLPDEDDGEDHPWSWLEELARARGLAVTADELRRLPYEVLLAGSLFE